MQQKSRRSPTAEAVFSRYPGIEALSAGTRPDAETPVASDLIDWAEVILVMEAAHRQQLSRRFPEQLRGKRLVVLSISDDYIFMDSQLITVLKAKVPPRTCA